MSASPARNVLVQGASRGLGLAFVRTLLEREGVRRVFASARAPERSPGLAALRERYAEGLHLIRLDVRDEASIETAARLVRETSPHLHLLLNVAGILHDAEGLRPEKRLGDVDPKLLRRAFEVNAFGPLLVAKHFASCLRHDERAVLVNVSARVGSIGDNRLGGWYAYRASKAAQNMFTRTLSIELARWAPNVCCVALHPGTVDTDLSRPFHRGVPPEKLLPADRAAARLLAVIDGLGRRDSGGFFDGDGRAIPW